MKKINSIDQTKKSAGQILVIFGISLVVLLLFVGLALDAGSVYVTYGQLKRAVDLRPLPLPTNSNAVPILLQ